MKILFWMIGLLSLLNATSTTVDPYKNIDYFKMKNGLQVYLLSDEKATKTQISLTVNVGYGVENDEDFGISHLVEHIVFRDQRVPHHDYLDYIKDEGGTYVNGHTKRYETDYMATIASEKSYWLAGIFAQMIFDKNVTLNDLEVERGALQAEINEPRWYLKLWWHFMKSIEALMPPNEDFHYNEFSLSKIKDIPPHYKSQENNQKFTLPQVLEHYNKYYYPANMKLRIAGNFSMPKMRELIVDSYGKVDKNGTLKSIKPPQNPTLSKKPYYRYYEGAEGNGGYIGSKYILDDYKKFLILDVYTTNLSERLQQELRNKQGNTYSVNGYNSVSRRAAIAAITFDGLHGQFEHNIKSVKEMLADDMRDINETLIIKALNNYNKRVYHAIEHDSSTLMQLIQTAEYMRDEHNITDKSSLEVFQTITPKEFKETIQKIFIPENVYSYILRDYYFFPLEMQALFVVSILLFLFVYFKISYIDLKKKGINYTKREILLTRRLSSRFIGFVWFVVVFMLAAIVWGWIKYLASKYIMGDPYWLMTIDVPYSYILTTLDPILNLVVFVIVYRIFYYYARIDVTSSEIYAVGNHIKALPKEEIFKITTMPWRASYFRRTLGTMMRFWKPLVKIEMRSGEVFYIRSNNVEHLQEDLQKWHSSPSV